MSTTRTTFTTLAAVSVSLFLAVGCAAGPEQDTDQQDDSNAPVATAASGDEGEAGDETAGDEEGNANPNAMPTVETDTVGTASTGMNCACPAGQQYQNGLCYPACGSGYTGEGPVCWQTCASGFTDTGWFCHRNSSIVKANTSKCPWYNKCGLGSSCSKCPSGYSNDGCTCRRDAYIYAQPSYGRGAGTTPSCSSY